jgi:hypothetical protein
VKPEHAPRASGPNLAPLPEGLIADIRVELDRLGVSYSRAGAGTYAALHDLGDVVWIKGPPRSGLFWEGAPEETLARLRSIPTDVDPPTFWTLLRAGS